MSWCQHAHCCLAPHMKHLYLLSFCLCHQQQARKSLVDCSSTGRLPRQCLKYRGRCAFYCIAMQQSLIMLPYQATFVCTFITNASESAATLPGHNHRQQQPAKQLCHHYVSSDIAGDATMPLHAADMSVPCSPCCSPQLYTNNAQPDAAACAEQTITIA